MNETFVSLVKYQSSSKCGDFNGPFSELSIDEQINYLRFYFDTFSKEKNFSVDNKSYDEKDIESLIKNVPFEKFEFRNRKQINSGKWRLTNTNEYKNVTLFNGAVVDSNKVKFLDAKSLPLPAAEFEFVDPFNTFEMSFEVSKNFHMPLRSKVDTMVPARNIEFRTGLNEVTKFGIYTDGSVYARVVKNDKYHHQNLFVGKYEFENKNTFSIRFYDDKIQVSVNETTTFIDYSTKQLPNTIFIGSGIHGTSAWDVEINNISYDNKPFNVFETRNNVIENEFANIELPLVFGTFANRHLSAEFISEFEINSVRNIVLGIDELGPRCDIYINNNLVRKSVGLTSYKENITKYVKQGTNELRVLIYPNAPENIISWHRNKDPYFGSYINGVFVEEINNHYIENVRIETTNTKDGITFNSFVNTNSKIENINVVIKDAITNEEIESKSFVKSGWIESKTICFPWSFDDPRLYKVFYELQENGTKIDEFEVITGFRTVDQKDGRINLNGKQVLLNGALLMQYLPPYENIVLNHVCPSFNDILRQCVSAKNMNSTCLRMHQLGCGSNDKRIGRVCDYLGISLIWTTKFNETILDVCNDEGIWKSKKDYQSQMIDVINSPSILIWEGSNELYLYREDIDKIYKEFVSSIKQIDNSRLISPVSHLYYGNDLYDRKCQYYQEDGEHDEFLKPAKAVEEWNDDLTIRSAHTYDILLGYGTTWDSLKRQPWSAQPTMLASEKHAYLITEYAVIGRQCPFVKESKTFFNNKSYEYPDELKNGYEFDDNHWFLSQAYQALATTFATRKMLIEGADGMMWCSLIGGANDGSYLKPIIDFYYHPKLAYYSLKDCFGRIAAFQNDTDIVWGKDHLIKPIIKTNSDNKEHNVTIKFTDLNDKNAFVINYGNVRFNKLFVHLPQKRIPVMIPDGYYKYYIIID